MQLTQREQELTTFAELIRVLLDLIHLCISPKQTNKV
jgi:hypothetical protein